MQAYTNEDSYLVMDSLSAGIRIVSIKHYQKLLTQIKSLQDENESLHQQLEESVSARRVLEQENKSIACELSERHNMTAEIEEKTSELKRCVLDLAREAGKIDLLKEQLREKDEIISSYDRIIGALHYALIHDIRASRCAGYWEGYLASPKSSQKLASLLDNSVKAIKNSVKVCNKAEKAIIDEVAKLLDAENE